jgi:hypothetical protein
MRTPVEKVQDQQSGAAGVVDVSAAYASDLPHGRIPMEESAVFLPGFTPPIGIQAAGHK